MTRKFFTTFLFLTLRENILDLKRKSIFIKDSRKKKFIVFFLLLLLFLRSRNAERNSSINFFPSTLSDNFKWIDVKLMRSNLLCKPNRRKMFPFRSPCASSCSIVFQILRPHNYDEIDSQLYNSKKSLRLFTRENMLQNMLKKYIEWLSWLLKVSADWCAVECGNSISNTAKLVSHKLNNIKLSKTNKAEETWLWTKTISKVVQLKANC